MNIVFMGTPDFSVPALLNLINNYNVIGVYTKEPKPQGRKMILTKSPVNITAEKFNIPVFTPKNFKKEETVEQLKNLHPDIIIVAAYGIILPQTVLDIPSLGCINIHASLLPNLRGANPIQRSILNGDSKTGITIMKMDAGMDTGDMLLKEEIEIDDNITYGDLENKMSELGAKMILEYLEKKDSIIPQKQIDNFTLAPKLDKEESKINWQNSAGKIHNLVRGLMPSPKAYFIHNDTQIKVLKTSLINETTNQPAGTILTNDLQIACGNGSIIKIEELQKSGGNPLTTKAFINGYKFEIGKNLND
ncbi:methionyl-tRNA formyltransferase [bacterium]|nr:methionyl-tRNA formyltransferase [bacterium]